MPAKSPLLMVVGVPMAPTASLAEGGVEVLRHGAVVAEFFGSLADVVPARELELADLAQHLRAIHGLEVLLLGAVGGTVTPTGPG